MRFLAPIQMFDASDVRANCPDCGRPVEMPTKQEGKFIVPAPIAEDEQGPIFVAACINGHLRAYQPWDDSEFDGPVFDRNGNRIGRYEIEGR